MKQCLFAACALLLPISIGCGGRENLQPSSTAEAEETPAAQATPSPPSSTEATPEKEDEAFNQEATAAAIRQLVPSAACISVEAMEELATSPVPHLDILESQPLTLALFAEKVLANPSENQQQRDAEFSFTSDSPPSPRQLMRVIDKSRHLGYYTLLQPEYLNEVTCQIEGEQATGTIAFDAGLVAGRVEYEASRHDGQWRIDAFALPVRDWRFVRQEDGKWRMHDHFGPVVPGRELPEQQVTGNVTLDGEPLAAGRLRFTLQKHPEFEFRSDLSESGKFEVSLPAGTYRVVIDAPADGDETEAPEAAEPEQAGATNSSSRYSGVAIEVPPGEGEMEVDLDLSSGKE